MLSGNLPELEDSAGGVGLDPAPGPPFPPPPSKRVVTTVTVCEHDPEVETKAWPAIDVTVAVHETGKEVPEGTLDVVVLSTELTGKYDVLRTVTVLLHDPLFVRKGLPITDVTVVVQSVGIELVELVGAG